MSREEWMENWRRDDRAVAIACLVAWPLALGVGALAYWLLT